MKTYEMFGPAGDKACQRMVDIITEKIASTEEMKANDLLELVIKELDYIALYKSEVLDEAPKRIMSVEINRALLQSGASFRIKSSLREIEMLMPEDQ